MIRLRNSQWRAPLLFLLANAALFADGGALVLRKQAGPLTISVFSSPGTLRIGPADFSVMVQRTTDQSTVTDATVSVHLTQSGAGAISEVTAPATHANASNKLLYAAKLTVTEMGAWRIAVNVTAKAGMAEVAGAITVLPQQSPLLAYWPYFAVVPVLLVLFVLNQLLKKRRAATRRPVRP